MTPAFALDALAIGKAWWKAALGAVVIFPAAFLLGQCDGARGERARVEAARVKATAAAEVRAARATGDQNAARATDTIDVERDRQERTNASQAQPDSRPSASRRARACEQLRQQGASAADRARAGCP